MWKFGLHPLVRGLSESRLYPMSSILSGVSGCGPSARARAEAARKFGRCLARIREVGYFPGVPESRSADALEFPRDFHTTRWSLVLCAGGAESGESAGALETLCRAYWYPLHAFVRRRGYEPEEARDLTQSFFAALLAKNGFGQADRERGRFRTFLLGALKHFLANEWDKARALKRGGGVTLVSIDERDDEDRYLHEPVDDLSPEKLFDRRWAETLIELVVVRLRGEYETTGHGERFDLCKPWLMGGEGEASYAEVAARLGIEETGVRTFVSRLRRRFRELMRAEIAQTVSGPADVDEEIRALFQALVG